MLLLNLIPLIDVTFSTPTRDYTQWGGLPTMQRESRYAGMTTNERLFDAGLLSEWTAAARSRGRERMIDLLGKVDLEDQAESITDTVLSNPGKYGF